MTPTFNLILTRAPMPHSQVLKDSHSLLSSGVQFLDPHLAQGCDKVWSPVLVAELKLAIAKLIIGEKVPL